MSDESTTPLEDSPGASTPNEDGSRASARHEDSPGASASKENNSGASTPRRGSLIVLVAPSGAGKSTLARKLFEEFPLLRFSVSATTRAPRQGEREGIDYHFLSEEAFNKAIGEDQFLEWESFYGGVRYGTLRTEVEKELEKGYFVLLDIEVNGALNVKAIYGEQAVAIFIQPPSLHVLESRLRARGTESESSLKLRLERAHMEMKLADRFDHIVVNDDLQTCYAELSRLVRSVVKPTD